MKTLTGDELDALNRIKEDVNMTLESNFSSFGGDFTKKLTNLSPIFVALFFKILNHNPENKDWKNRDRVFATDNLSNITKNVTKVHAGYEVFDNLKLFLDENDFNKVENSFGEAIGHALVSRDIDNNHKRYFYIIQNEEEIFSNIYSLEYISKNKLGEIMIILYTKFSHEELKKQTKLNEILTALGFDTIIISGENINTVYDGIIYAKKLNKPTIILVSINN